MFIWCVCPSFEHNCFFPSIYLAYIFYNYIFHFLWNPLLFYLYSCNLFTSLAFRSFPCIPNGIAKSRKAYTIKKVDLTETFITDLSNLKFFLNIEILVLDKNNLNSILSCPVLPKVHTLWCNNNKISALESFLNEIVERFPNLQYLSLMRNPVSMIQESETEEPGQISYVAEGMMRYRLGILSKLPGLRMLDSVSNCGTLLCSYDNYPVVFF